jgi:predicted nucleotide-binding protein (sugar kinase/HSP70/actin superfamily)
MLAGMILGEALVGINDDGSLEHLQHRRLHYCHRETGCNSNHYICPIGTSTCSLVKSYKSHLTKLMTMVTDL